MNTPAIHLRAIEPEDLDLLYRIENDTALWNQGITNVPYSRFTLHEYIANTAADIYADRQVRLIIENEKHETVGIADLVNYEPRHCRAEIGLVIEQPFRRMGYARAAIVQLHNYACTVLHLHQLYVIIASDNDSAIRLFESLDYNHSSTLPHWLYDGKAYHDAILMQKFL
ncbi:MAG: GNAT family N-acetyltransferase [Prevotella sp.]|nr:GNAT family N-acetyltransferase [Prevotella sp.]